MPKPVEFVVSAVVAFGVCWLIQPYQAFLQPNQLPFVGSFYAYTGNVVDAAPDSVGRKHDVLVQTSRASLAETSYVLWVTPAGGFGQPDYGAVYPYPGVYRGWHDARKMTVSIGGKDDTGEVFSVEVCRVQGAALQKVSEYFLKFQSPMPSATDTTYEDDPRVHGLDLREDLDDVACSGERAIITRSN